jgi:hypothetical protein
MTDGKSSGPDLDTGRLKVPMGWTPPRHPTCQGCGFESQRRRRPWSRLAKRMTNCGKHVKQKWPSRRGSQSFYGVSRGGFYAWLTRPRSERSRSDEELGAKVRASFLASDRTYGARRVWHDLLSLIQTTSASTGSARCYFNRTCSGRTNMTQDKSK